jgi:hypothetical protein
VGNEWLSLLVDTLIPKEDSNEERTQVVPLQSMVVGGDRCGRQARNVTERKKENVKPEHRTDTTHTVSFRTRMLKPSVLPEGGSVSSYLKVAIKDTDVSFEPDVFLMTNQMRGAMEKRYEMLQADWPMGEMKMPKQGDGMHTERTEAGNMYTKTANRALFGADALRKKDEEAAFQTLMDIYMSNADAAAEIETRRAVALTGSTRPGMGGTRTSRKA